MMRAGTTQRLRSSDEGFTFLEVLITLSILSISFIAILSAVISLIFTADEHQKLTTLEGVVRNVGEFVKSPTSVPYESCTSDPSGAYSSSIATAPAGTFPTGYTVAVVSVETWDGPGKGTYTADCGFTGNDTGVQHVTVTVTTTSRGRTISQQLAVTKRNAS